MLFSCAKVPPGKSAIDSVSVVGNDAVGDDDILKRIATSPSPKFLGLWSGVIFDYALFDRVTLARDMARVERFYRARGYYDARARAARVEGDGEHVRVTIVVEEGPPVLIDTVRIEGADDLPDETKRALARAATARLKKDSAFDEDDFEASEKEATRALTDRGHAFARISREAEVDAYQHRARIVFRVTPGPVVRFGDVRIEGLGDLPESVVRRTLDLKPGAPYSTDALEDAKQAVLELGVFGSVSIDPDLSDDARERGVVPVLVRVEPTQLRAVQLGIGVELDILKTDVHLPLAWENRNMLGGLRHFSVRFKPGLVFYPTRLPTLQAPDRLLPEERLRVELNQPAFLEARTRGMLSGELNHYPVLLSPRIDEAATVIGYRELRGSTGVSRRFFRHLDVNPSYNLQANFPFSYHGPLDASLESVIVSYVDLFVALDFRDDSIHPRKGIYLAHDTEFAGDYLVGEARDVRMQPEVRGYVPLFGRVSLALRGSLGFLLPLNYGDAFSRWVGRGSPPPDDFSGWNRDLQFLFFRGFFSGGSNSNRGYALRGVGPHGPIPFFNPDIAAAQVARACDPSQGEVDATRCALPLGGLTLWEASAEVRFPISVPLWGATFCDASDVAPKRWQLRPERPHLSCGGGVRYDTPVGPIRLDIGYRIPGMQVIGRSMPSEEGSPTELFGFFPGAISLGVGEAF